MRFNVYLASFKCVFSYIELAAAQIYCIGHYLYTVDGGGKRCARLSSLSGFTCFQYIMKSLKTTQTVQTIQRNNPHSWAGT